MPELLSDVSNPGFCLDEAEQEDELEFYCSGPPTGWTDSDTMFLEKALNLAGIIDPAERLRAGLAVDLMGIVILTPLVRQAECELEHIRNFFRAIQGGIGK